MFVQFMWLHNITLRGNLNKSCDFVLYCNVGFGQYNQDDKPSLVKYYMTPPDIITSPWPSLTSRLAFHHAKKADSNPDPPGLDSYALSTQLLSPTQLNFASVHTVSLILWHPWSLVKLYFKVGIALSSVADSMSLTILINHYSITLRQNRNSC